MLPSEVSNLSHKAHEQWGGLLQVRPSCSLERSPGPVSVPSWSLAGKTLQFSNQGEVWGERQETSLLWSLSHSPSQSLSLQGSRDDRPEVPGTAGFYSPKVAVPGCLSVAPALCPARREHTGGFGCSFALGCRGGAPPPWVSLSQSMA